MVRDRSKLSKDAMADPTRSENRIQGFENSITKLFDDFKVALQKAIEDEALTKMVHADSSLPFMVDLEKFYESLDALVKMKLTDPGKVTIDMEISKSYKSGQRFASIWLGAPPEVRRAEWSKIKTLIDKNNGDFVGISDAMSKEIRTVISDGVLNESKYGDIVNDIMDRCDKIGKSRAQTMVRSESMFAVNEGVKDTIETDGIEEYERLEAADEKTCRDWEFNISGTTYMGCAEIDGKVFTREEADEIDQQTHPRCRGTWIPHVRTGEEPQKVVAKLQHMTDRLAGRLRVFFGAEEPKDSKPGDLWVNRDG